MTAIAITGMGLTGVLRITWVHDNLGAVPLVCIQKASLRRPDADRTPGLLLILAAEHTADLRPRSRKSGGLAANLLAAENGNAHPGDHAGQGPGILKEC
jgi:hypothetical protein